MKIIDIQLLYFSTSVEQASQYHNTEVFQIEAEVVTILIDQCRKLSRSHKGRIIKRGIQLIYPGM